ncbi:hypothetical protein RUM44_000995 [Polyplax serrata]|uniref:Serendipity locus protein alpha n=1 Tax=Polyplax serrata TaxID=468196 RepID=A0ABR1B7H0_POLSC
MENLPIKLNELSPIIISLIEKIQILDSGALMKEEKALCRKEMLDIVTELRSFFEEALKSLVPGEHTKIFIERIERAFSQFEWDANVGISPYEFQKHSDNARVLMTSILKLLGMKGAAFLIIETYVKLCAKIVDEMLPGNPKRAIDVKNFKLLLDAVLTMTKVFIKYWHIALKPNQKNSIALCLSQVCKVLPFLLKMIEIGNSDVGKFALQMIMKCINKIMSDIHSNGNLQATDCGQEFITLMEFCLNKLNEVARDGTDLIEKIEEAVATMKPMIDDIICYAMSVSQVTGSDNDRSGILNASLKVIREFEDLKNMFDNIDIYQVKLNSRSVGESLCNLERQVNTAVLRLVLEVFTGINCPLKNIVNKCKTDIQKDNKVTEDLNVLISEFDKEMDKIMQIGLFAISCTSDSSRILRIQSCLASLESLETELIPVLTTLYIDCNAKNKSNFQQLIDLWLEEMTELKNLIDSILDPAGFCDIVNSQINLLMVNLKETLNNNPCLGKAKPILFKIIRYSKKLIKTLRKNFEDESVSNETEEYLKKFQIAVQECEAMDKLLDEEHAECKDINKTVNRVLKRGEFLQGELKKLSSHLFVLACEEKLLDSETDDDLRTPIPQKNYYKLCYSAQSATENNIDMDVLTPYICNGIMRSKRRSILYGTPTKMEKELKKNFDATLLQARHWSNTPKSKKRSRCCKPLNMNLELANTIDLEITTILENLSQLNSTFNKSFVSEKKNWEKEKKDETCGTETNPMPSYKSTGCLVNKHSFKAEPDSENQKPPNENIGGEILLGTQLRNRVLQSLTDLSQNAALFVSTDSDGVSDFSTPERHNDLKIVEEKINFLKEQMPCMLP